MTFLVKWISSSVFCSPCNKFDRSEKKIELIAHSRSSIFLCHNSVDDVILIVLTTSINELIKNRHARAKQCFEYQRKKKHFSIENKKKNSSSLTQSLVYYLRPLSPLFLFANANKTKILLSVQLTIIFVCLRYHLRVFSLEKIKRNFLLFSVKLWSKRCTTKSEFN